MPLTPAERMKRYREKLKANPEKYEEYKKKHAKLVKSKTKTVTELPDEEKEKLRKKWREQKQKQTLKKKKIQATNCDSAEAQTKGPKKQNTVKTRKITRQYKSALKKINSLTKTLQNTRKKMYRNKLQYEKEIETLNTNVTNMKVREEVMESTLKSLYSKCHTNEEKKLMKTPVNDENIVAAKMKNTYAKLLGLKGRIRKSKERVKNIKSSIEIEKFFNRDDVSRITAGKRECRTFKKKKEQIRYLIDSLLVLYQKYKSENGKYSYATFYRYKPFYVLSPNVNNRDTCLCIRHNNIELKLYTLHKHGILTHLKSMKDVISKLCCDTNSCQTCNKVKLDYNLEDKKVNHDVNWFQWQRIDHKYEKNENGKIKTIITKKSAKVNKTGTINLLIEDFEKEIPTFKIHYFTWIHQQRQYQKCINELEEYEALIICDFSENYQCKMANEIQSMHFGAAKAQITLHTGMIYWANASQSFCTVSDNNCHEPQAIWAHLLPIFTLLKKNNPKVTVIHFFSDGPSSQCRQKKNFFLHNLFTFNLGLKYLTWSFSESGHGKGVADGIGGAVKRALDLQVAYGKDISDARDAYEILKNVMKSVKCYLIKTSDILTVNSLLPQTLTPVNGTLKIHQFISYTPGKIMHRTHTCFCSKEKGMGDCFSPKIHDFTNQSKNTLIKKSDTADTQERNIIEANDYNTDLILEVAGTTENENDVKKSDTTDTQEMNIIEANDYNKDLILEVAVTTENKNDVKKSDTADTQEMNIIEANDYNKDLILEVAGTTENDDVDFYHTENEVDKEAEKYNKAILLEVTGTTKDEQNAKQSLQPTPHLSRKRKDILSCNNNKSNMKRICDDNSKLKSASLKTIVKRQITCHECKIDFPFQISMAKCIVCHHSICLKCSQGLQTFDYICNPCLGYTEPYYISD